MSKQTKHKIFIACPANKLRRNSINLIGKLIINDKNSCVQDLYLRQNRFRLEQLSASARLSSVMWLFSQVSIKPLFRSIVSYLIVNWNTLASSYIPSPSYMLAFVKEINQIIFNAVPCCIYIQHIYIYTYVFYLSFFFIKRTTSESLYADAVISYCQKFDTVMRFGQRAKAIENDFDRSPLAITPRRITLHFDKSL